MKNTNPEKAYLKAWEDPNLREWRQSRDHELQGVERGHELVYLLCRHIAIKGKKVLDSGSGDGGISIALALAGAKVTSLEPESSRVYRSNLRYNGYRLNINLIQGKTGEILPRIVSEIENDKEINI